MDLTAWIAWGAAAWLIGCGLLAPLAQEWVSGVLFKTVRAWSEARTSERREKAWPAAAARQRGRTGSAALQKEAMRLFRRWKLLNRARLRGGGNPEILAPLAVELYEAGDSDEANRAADLAAIGDPASALLVCDALMAIRQNHKALSRQKRLLEKFPGAWPLRRQMGRVFFEECDWPEALETFDRVLKDAPDDLETLHWKAATLSMMDRGEEGARILMEALSKGDDRKTRVVLGGLLTDLGQAGEADRLLAEASGKWPDSPDVLCARARARAVLGNRDGASEILDEVLTLDPFCVDALIAKGSLELDGSNPEAALRWFEKAVALEPGNTEALTRMGRALNDSGRLEEAHDALQKALALKSKNGEAMLEVGKTFVRLGQYETARLTLKHALRFVKDPERAHYWLGIACLRSEAFQEAVLFLKKADAARPSRDETLSALALACEGRGQWGDALAAWKAALAVNPDSSEAREGMERTANPPGAP